VKAFPLLWKRLTPCARLRSHNNSGKQIFPAKPLEKI